jgi:hypothetical protein
MPSSKRQALILALLQSTTLAQACKKVGVNYRTARRWHVEEGFQAELKAAKDEAFAHGLRLLQGNITSAAAVLFENLKADKPSDSTSAARAILEFAFRGKEVTELQKEVEECKEIISDFAAFLGEKFADISRGYIAPERREQFIADIRKALGGKS